MKIRSLSNPLTFLLLLSAVGSAEEYRQARLLDGAENRLDVTYLPDRVTGNWQDRWLKMNLHWPDGLKADERRPCILFVHGGGYGGGDKDSSFCKQAMQRAIEQGFVVVNLNYILGRDIFPQVFYDFDAAVRFLRSRASEYHIDPDRIGAWGFSAGGWLSSSAAFTDAGDLYVGGKTAVSESWPEGDPRRTAMLARAARGDKKGNLVLAVPMDDPRPLYGEYSSRIQALQADFLQFEENITNAAPVLCSYIGKGGLSKLQEPAAIAGVEFLALVLEHPKKKFDGSRAVHVPPLDMTVPAPDGKGEMELQDRVIAWFQQKLVDEPTTPAPEFRPQVREFRDQISVDAITGSTGTRVHYTTDGSTPTVESPVWDGTQSFRETTTINALAVKNGLKPSGIATVRFVQGNPPPSIVEPRKNRFKGKVGQPLMIRFVADTSKPVVWNLTAHFRSELGHRFKGGFKEFSGLLFDSRTGTLGGTPIKSFVYTLQAQAAWKPGGRADARTYVLEIAE